MDLKRLPFANVRQHLGRTVGLMVLVALLAFVVYGGTLVMSSLQNGLASLESRLGADILVAPATAASKNDLEEILTNGTPGEFYMNRSAIQQIAAREGVEAASPQYYLATIKAGCCSYPLQIIGFDPETDFTVQPWIDRGSVGALDREQIITGCNVTGAPGATLRFYGVDCTIVARLSETGTALDNAVFCTIDTVSDLIAAARTLDVASHDDFDPTQVVSTVLVKVANGYNVEQVLGDIKVHVRGVSAVQTKAMTSSVADSVAGTASVVGTLMAVIWVFAAAVLVVAFVVIGRSRTREFAILRVLGASRKALARIVLTESVVISAIGAVAGVLLAGVLVLAFNSSLEGALGLPFLTPDAGTLAGYALLAFALAMIAGPAASAVSALRLSKVDPGQVLREE